MKILAGDIAIKGSDPEKEVQKILQGLGVNSEGYCGYKTPSVGIVDPSEIPSFVIFKRDFGVILLDVVQGKVSGVCDEPQFWQMNDNNELFSRDYILDDFSNEISTRLKKYPELYDRISDKLLVNITKILVFVSNTKDDIKDILSSELKNDYISNENWGSDIKDYIEARSNGNDIEEGTWKKMVAVLEGSSHFEKGKKTRKTKDAETKFDLIQQSLERTFCLDDIQRVIALQIPDGPQRIRGLAGTGKTVILSMKAALAHKNFPEFKILYAFHTQSLYQIIRSYISKYFVPEAKRAVDENLLQVYHSWGGKWQPGIYYNLCIKYGVEPLTWGDARGYSDPLEFIFKDLLEKVGDRFEPEFDMILIDEAQDFPPSFFEVIYKISKEPKRIVWAYDEFQSLKGLRIKEPEELFGKKIDGTPNMPNDILNGTYDGGIEKDFILPNSYRNPMYNLVVGHALGLGVYSPEGIIDVLGDKESWEAIGYHVKSPDKLSFSEGDKVQIERDKETSKNDLEQAYKDFCTRKQVAMQSTVQFLEKTPDDINKEIDAVVENIKQLVEEENIPPHEIVVITLNKGNTAKILDSVRKKLDRFGIDAVTPGIIEKSDVYKREGCVTLATPYKAKGNESYIVFVINSNFVIGDRTYRSRNELFVSITRSLGWCFVTGFGKGYDDLRNEYVSAKSHYPKIEFTYPKEEDLRRRRIILAKQDAKMEKDDKLLDSIIESNEELLLEKLKGNPELLEKILKMRGE